MPVYNVQAYVGEAIESVLSQTYQNLELIIIDDGSTDESSLIAQSFLQHDDRVRYHRKVNAGLGAARNTGVELAIGKYLVFVDSDDVVPASAYRRMVRRLEKTGSDLATGNVVRFDSKRSYPSWNQSVSHVENRFGISLKDNPALLADTTSWNKVFRRTFWDRAGLEFVEGRLYEDMVPMTKAFLAASSIDVHASRVYRWRIRQERSSITQRRQDIENLRDRVDMVHECLKLVAGQPTLIRVLDEKALEADLWTYTPHLGFVSDEYDAIFAKAFAELWNDDLLDRESHLLFTRAVFYSVYNSVGIEAAHQTLAWVNAQPSGLPTAGSGGDLRLIPPEFLDTEEIPADTWLPRDLVRPIVKVTSVDWVDGSLVIEGHAHVEYLGVFDDGGLEISLRSSDGEASIRMGVERRFDATISHTTAKTNIDVRKAGFRAKVAARELVAHVDASAIWQVDYLLTVGTETFTGEVALFDRTGAGRFVRSPILDDRFSVETATLNGQPMTLSVTRHDVRVLEASLVDREARLVLENTAGRPLAQILVDFGKKAPLLDIDIKDSGTGTVRSAFAFPAPESIGAIPDVGQQNAARVRAAFADGSSAQEILVPESVRIDNRRADAEMRLARSRTRAVLEFVMQSRVVRILEVTGRGTTVRIRTEAKWPDDYRLGIMNHIGAVTLGRRIDESHVDLDLSQLDINGRTTVLPSGLYELAVFDADGDLAEDWQVVVTDDVVDEVPFVVHGDLFRFTLRFGSRNQGEVRIDPPLDLEREVGALQQRDLRDRFFQGNWSAESAEPTVFLTSFGGTNFGCHPAALGRELLRGGYAGRILAEVIDHSVSLPEGIEPVVRRSAKWHEALAGSSLIINNVSFYDDHYQKRPGQIYLQTWHGTPLKRIGHDIVGRGVSAGFQARTDREAETMWDRLLTTSAFDSEVLPGALGFGGDYLELGSPRLDDLVNQTDLLAERVRRYYRIASGKRVVLYAPTWRDDGRASESLDVEEFSRRFGADHVLLIRAHPNVLDSVAKQAVDRSVAVIDASRYPIAEHLYAVADVLVTDYSSVLFDYAVTERPQIFFAPDLAQYRDMERGFYLDYAATVPGPVCVTDTEVFEQLENLGTLRNDFAVKRKEFRKRFGGLEDGKASERVLAAMFELLNAAPAAG